MTNAVPGSSLTLTIDTGMQKDAQKALTWAMEKIGLKRGVVIAMNPQTGEILAMVSLPTYDNNLFARGISTADFNKLLKNPDKPLLDHAIQEHFPPGSTYKLVTGTGGLNDRDITPSTRVQTRGYLTLGGTRFYDWNHQGFGGCNIYCGFGHSSDTFFFQVAGSWGPTGWATTPRNTASASRPASTSRARPPGSSRPTPGNRKPLVRRCSVARRIRRVSGRATTS